MILQEKTTEFWPTVKIAEKYHRIYPFSSRQNRVYLFIAREAHIPHDHVSKMVPIAVKFQQKCFFLKICAYLADQT